MGSTWTQGFEFFFSEIVGKSIIQPSGGLFEWGITLMPVTFTGAPSRRMTLTKPPGSMAMSAQWTMPEPWLPAPPPPRDWRPGRVSLTRENSSELKVM